MSTGPTSQSVKPKLATQPDLNQSAAETGRADRPPDQGQQTTSISGKSGLDWHQLHGDSSSVNSRHMNSNQGSSVDKAQREAEAGVPGLQPCIRLPQGSADGQSIHYNAEVKTGTQVIVQFINCCLLG